MTSDFLRIGRASDCDITLPDPRIMLQQASLLQSAGRYFFITDDEAITEIINNGVRDNEIAQGSTVRLGPYELRFESGTADYDLAVFVELVVPLDDGLSQMRASPTRLSRTAMKMAAIATVVALPMFLIFIGWPIWESLERQDVPTISERSSDTQHARDVPAILANWESGKLTAPHRFLSRSCVSCHEKPFQDVANGACLSCHNQAEHHVDPDDQDLPAVQKGLCTACHQEHRTESQLVIRDDRFCVGCHSELKSVSAETELVDVHPGIADHPAFKATIVVDASTGKRVREALTVTSKITEKSNLRFPHHVHVAKQGIKIPGTDRSQKLVCEDCHTPDAGGMSMQPIDMESHCISCHKLEFDPSAKERGLPYAKPKAVQALIYDFYLAQEAGKARDRLEYGTSTADPTGKDTELHRALARAEERHTGILEFVFKSICGTCHEPTKLDAKSDLKWTVEPVNLSSHWFPKAKFDHGSHRTVDCGECHDAKLSTKSSDILLPKLETCLKCHGPADELNRVPTTCVTCHDFHLEGLPSMVEDSSAD
ncbi:MAG: hypothetical protein HOK54_15540 [Alphaproteobacteria bacterium]|nr:hypothetical protein [Alphaproteobacteria bacterium]